LKCEWCECSGEVPRCDHPVPKPTAEEEEEDEEEEEEDEEEEEEPPAKTAPKSAPARDSLL